MVAGAVFVNFFFSYLCCFFLSNSGGVLIGDVASPTRGRAAVRGGGVEAKDVLDAVLARAC